MCSSFVLVVDFFLLLFFFVVLPHVVLPSVLTRFCKQKEADIYSISLFGGSYDDRFCCDDWLFFCGFAACCASVGIDRRFCMQKEAEGVRRRRRTPRSRRGRKLGHA